MEFAIKLLAVTSLLLLVSVASSDDANGTTTHGLGGSRCTGCLCQIPYNPVECCEYHHCQTGCKYLGYDTGCCAAIESCTYCQCVNGKVCPVNVAVAKEVIPGIFQTFVVPANISKNVYIEAVA